MNRAHILVGSVAAICLVVAAPAPLAAQSALGPYLALGGGLDDMAERNLNINGHEVSSQWKEGWGAFAAVGYKWYFGLRTEAEFSGRVSWVKDFNHTAPWAGTQWDDSLMFNALYDFEFDSRLRPMSAPVLAARRFSGATISGFQPRPRRPSTMRKASGWAGRPLRACPMP